MYTKEILAELSEIEGTMKKLRSSGKLLIDMKKEYVEKTFLGKSILNQLSSHIQERLVYCGIDTDSKLILFADGHLDLDANNIQIWNPRYYSRSTSRQKRFNSIWRLSRNSIKQIVDLINSQNNSKLDDLNYAIQTLSQKYDELYLKKREYTCPNRVISLLPMEARSSLSYIGIKEDSQLYCFLNGAQNFNSSKHYRINMDNWEKSRTPADRLSSVYWFGPHFIQKTLKKFNEFYNIKF